jgi:hypothetical protein
VKARRLPGNPIIHPGLDARIGGNINGPSVIRAPDWLPNALGRYYLYFAHHRGTFIRLAYADRVEGPWSIHPDGVLDLAGSWFDHHIASPDVHVDDAGRRIRMYYHGGDRADLRHQSTRVATSADGLAFTAQPEVLGLPYWRGFEWDGRFFGLAMPGVLYRSTDPLGGYERGPTLLPPRTRHCAVAVVGSVMRVLFTCVGDRPERILGSEVPLRGDWGTWSASDPVTVLEPETDWEGAYLPLEASVRGPVDRPARQLRDPFLFREDGNHWLFYAVAGESGIAVARLLGAT